MILNTICWFTLNNSIDELFSLDVNSCLYLAKIEIDLLANDLMIVILCKFNKLKAVYAPSL